MATRPHPKSEAQVFHCFQELPKFLTMTDVADCLRISVASAYTLSREKDFPLVIFNCQRRVRRDRFLAWLNSREVGYGAQADTEA